jgi:hypothetical protein
MRPTALRVRPGHLARFWRDAPLSLQIASGLVSATAVLTFAWDVIALVGGGLRPLSMEQISRMTAAGANPKGDVGVILIFVAFAFGIVMVTLGPLALALLVVMKVKEARIVLGVVAVIYFLAAVSSGNVALVVSSTALVVAWGLMLFAPTTAYLGSEPS